MLLKDAVFVKSYPSGSSRRARFIGRVAECRLAVSLASINPSVVLQERM